MSDTGKHGTEQWGGEKTRRQTSVQIVWIKTIATEKWGKYLYYVENSELRVPAGALDESRRGGKSTCDILKSSNIKGIWHSGII